MPGECLGCRTREDDLAACGRELAMWQEANGVLNRKLTATKDALATLYLLIEAGVLVRNTAEDHLPEFGRRQIPLVAALINTKKLLES